VVAIAAAVIVVAVVVSKSRTKIIEEILIFVV